MDIQDNIMAINIIQRMTSKQFNGYLVYCYSWIQVPTFTYQLILLQLPNQVQCSNVTI